MIAQDLLPAVPSAWKSLSRSLESFSSFIQMSVQMLLLSETPHCFYVLLLLAVSTLFMCAL
jgi:hypothetical protein